MMNPHFNYYQFYTALSSWLSRYPRLITILRWTNRLVVVTMYGAYLLILAGVCWRHRAVPLVGLRTAAPLVVIPGLGFFLVSFFRHCLNAPRPYDEWAISPLISREKHGDSLPSRHVFSATVISLVAWRVVWPLGVVLLVLTVILGLVRIIGGVHYPRDIIAGMLCGIICGACLWIF